MQMMTTEDASKQAERQKKKTKGRGGGESNGIVAYARISVVSGLVSPHFCNKLVIDIDSYIFSLSHFFLLQSFKSLFFFLSLFSLTNFVDFNY